MDQKETKHSKCGLGMWGEGCGHGWCHAVKWLIWLAVLATVFVFGMSSGAMKTARYYGYNSGSGSVWGLRSGMMNGFGYGAQSVGKSWMMGGYDRDAASNLQKAFGSITSIEGNKITLTDNGGGAVAVLSTANTTILAGQEEVSLNALASGQDIRVVGTMNASNELEAKYIYTQGY